MFKKVLMGLAVLLALVVLAVGGLFVTASNNYNKASSQIHEDPSLALEVQENQAWVEEGGRIARMKGCFDCHGPKLDGKVFIDDPAVGSYSASNLTPGKGGVGARYSSEDWVRAIRFGRGPDKKYLRFMPSVEFAQLTDEDLAKLIVYLKSLPAVDNELKPTAVGPMAKVLFMFNKMPLLLSGKDIADGHKPIVKLETSDSAEYGKYLAAGCVGCHNPSYTGGQIPGVPPEWPHAADLSSKGNLAKWDFAAFKKTLTTGVTPEGKTLNPQFMPWQATAAMSDTELKALYAFLKTLP